MTARGVPDRASTGIEFGDGDRLVRVRPPDPRVLLDPVTPGCDPLTTGRDPATARVTTTEAAKALSALRPSFKRRDLVCHPDFEIHNRRRLAWQQQRMRELMKAHGGVSSAVGAMINDGAWAHASAEFFNEKGAETGDSAYFIQARAQGTAARNFSLAAWDLSAREAIARRARDPGAGNQMSDLLSAIREPAPRAIAEVDEPLFPITPAKVHREWATKRPRRPKEDP